MKKYLWEIEKTYNRKQKKGKEVNTRMKKTLRNV